MSKLEVAYTEEEKLKAAYALNMCTVSVSQILDYNDSYILEQEYDAILNNLNLKQMPKDEALLKILVELLNTITFFRIQNKRKEMIEKEYQNNIKNAIWSAVPHLVVVANGDPVSMVMSIATQVGIGYMNYRKEKASSDLKKEKQEMELEITAIEQFNALKRELFTTAWRLADEYDFKDEYRLTEKQISQYNRILMDSDLFRKKERLESIQDKFEAYPPFWYHLGHTINNLAINESDTEIRKHYQSQAKECFEKYHTTNDKFAILREDQISSACALEHVDLLFLEENYDKEKVEKLLQHAVKAAGNANDILELCMIAYLKMGNIVKAKNLLKLLVNEDYNTITNARLLSRIYVSEYLNNIGNSTAQLAKREYDVLSARLGAENRYLFIMPQDSEDADSLDERYMDCQRSIIAIEYFNMLYALKKVYHKRFALVLPPVANERAFESQIKKMGEVNFQKEFIEILNELMCALDKLTWFRDCDTYEKKNMIRLIMNRIFNLRKQMQELQGEKDKPEFKMNDYNKRQKELSFNMFTKEFFCMLNEYFSRKSKEINTLGEISLAEDDLMVLCRDQGIDLDTVFITNEVRIDRKASETCYFPLKILGPHMENEQLREDRIKKMIEIIEENKTKILNKQNSNTKFYIKGEDAFEKYFKNGDLTADGQDILAVIDDTSKKNVDLLFSCEGIYRVIRNHIRTLCPYSEIDYQVNSTGKAELVLSYFGEHYSNDAIDCASLYELVEKLENFEQEDAEK